MPGSLPDKRGLPLEQLKLMFPVPHDVVSGRLFSAGILSRSQFLAIIPEATQSGLPMLRHCGRKNALQLDQHGEQGYLIYLQPLRLERRGKGVILIFGAVDLANDGRVFVRKITYIYTRAYMIPPDVCVLVRIVQHLQNILGWRYSACLLVPRFCT